MWLILVARFSIVTSFISLRKCNNMFPCFINSHIDKFIRFLRTEYELSCKSEIKWVINFANTEHVIDLDVIFQRNPEAAIIFFGESNLLFGLRRPFRWMIAPITFPFKGSPRISYLYYSINLSFTIKNFCNRNNTICMARNYSQLICVIIVFVSFVSNTCCNNITMMISFIKHFPSFLNIFINFLIHIE